MCGNVEDDNRLEGGEAERLVLCLAVKTAASCVFVFYLLPRAQAQAQVRFSRLSAFGALSTNEDESTYQ